MTLLWYKDLESINIKTVRVLDLLKDGDKEWMHLCGTFRHVSSGGKKCNSVSRHTSFFLNFKI